MVDEPVERVRSMTGFDLVSQAGFVSAAGVSTSAKSSDEHAISGVSVAVVMTRGRVCETAEVVQITRAKQATRTVLNGFRSTINGELPSPKKFVFLFSYVRRAPLKDRGILAAGERWFNKQCDCFVTKQHAACSGELKEVTN